MIELPGTVIISLGVYDSPLIDRRVQSTLLHILSHLTREYGYAIVPISEVMDATNDILHKEGIPSLSREALNIFLAGFNNYGLQIELVGNTVRLIPFCLKNLEEELHLQEGSIEKSCTEVFNTHKPIYLTKKLREAELCIKGLSSRRIEFLSTSKIHGKKEISDRLAEMIDRAQGNVFIMLAFYQEDVSFFSNFLGNKVLDSDLDLKIIYNPKDKKNREFIRRLRKTLGMDRDFFRIYDPNHLEDEYERKFIGNLHSKAVITETELLVGSANLTGMSMYHNVENAIYTNDGKAVGDAKDFFVDLWDRLRPVYAI